MSTDRDTARIVRSWLRTDELESADRVLDAVLDALDTTPQRRAGWPAWRTPIMNRFLTIGLGAAAVVVLLFVGAQLFGSPRANLGGPGVEPTPTPEASVAEPSVEPTPSATPEGLLPEGSHVLWTMGVPMTVTIPAPGWHGEPADGILLKNDNPDPPDGAGMIVFAGLDEFYVYGDPCEWSTTKPDMAATTVDEIVAALASQASRDASEPVDVTLEGYAGKSITLHVPDDASFGECDQGQFASWAWGNESPSRWHQGPGQIDKLWILDVGGELVVIDIAYYEGTPQVIVDELEAIVDSITFEE